ncbi:MAG: 16S rRNA (guanine(527)-N(7))-methyltransferase RsmG [Candidatus Gracilibacteria bacterium]|nr:16S rRNA (guanine(527)-N(7))-methyltransferase RsmG [Candidatus Gracilibacteria bacterium]
MKSLFEKYNINLEDDKIKKFEKFLEIFIEKNSMMNLSAIRDEEGIIIKHFIDSLMLTKFTNLNGKIADLGSGGGFPGIPLKIFFPEIELTMIDSVGKKIKASEEFASILGLDKTYGLAGRAEEIGQDSKYREKYNFVVSRAMAYFPALLEFALPLVKVGGYFIAYKLDNFEEIEEGQKALIELGGTIEKIEKYEIEGQSRILIFVKKTYSTHRNYPRRIGEPIKNPIK